MQKDMTHTAHKLVFCCPRSLESNILLQPVISPPFSRWPRVLRVLLLKRFSCFFFWAVLNTSESGFKNYFLFHNSCPDNFPHDTSQAISTDRISTETTFTWLMFKLVYVESSWESMTYDRFQFICMLLFVSKISVKCFFCCCFFFLKNILWCSLHAELLLETCFKPKQLRHFKLFLLFISDIWDYIHGHMGLKLSTFGIYLSFLWG